jgi:hypothetical protein
MCRIHYKKSESMVSELETVMYCTAETAKGKQCKCRAFRGFDFCFTHAKKQGLVTVPTECAICYEAMTSDNKTKTVCGHYFHTSCLEKWAETRGKVCMVRGKPRYSVLCPMCRNGLTIKAPPPQPPAWYTHGGAPPTIDTTGAEWIERLQAVRMSPMMTSEDVEMAALFTGLALLSEYMQRGVWPDPYWESTVLRIQGLTRRG